MSVRPARLSAALLALSLGLVGCAGTAAQQPTSSTSGSTATPTTTSAPAEESQRIEVSITGGAASGDTGRVPVTAGTPVTLVITTDAADEVHVHGYDLAAELVPGEPAEIAFDATIPGVFEVELHEAGTVLLTLQVQ